MPAEAVHASRASEYLFRYCRQGRHPCTAVPQTPLPAAALILLRKQACFRLIIAQNKLRQIPHDTSHKILLVIVLEEQVYVDALEFPEVMGRCVLLYEDRRLDNGGVI